MAPAPKFHSTAYGCDSTARKTFGELVDALLADVGDKPVPIDDFAVRFESWAAYEREVQSHVGPSGFMLFALLTTVRGSRKPASTRKVLRVVIGNPLIAITMLRHDVTAGLFAPVELLITEEEDGRKLPDLCRAVVADGGRGERAASRGRPGTGRKLAALATKVTAA